MNKKVFCLRILTGVLVLLMAAPPWTMAQRSETGGTFTQEEMDQMLAPIALYPDSLLAQILVAATFPDEVVGADQWVKQNEGLTEDELNAALDKMDWDLSVKALAPFPKVLSMMSDKREWTQRLGEAFLAQQTNVMDTVQSLRAKANAQGNLKSTDQQKVVVKGESIEIEPANPRVVYVPAYNPTVIYGPWWYPSYPPYAYSPYYPGYVYDPGYAGTGFITAGLFGFAAGIAVGSAWNNGWGHWDWGHRNMRVNMSRNININRNIRMRGIRTTSLTRVVNQRRTGARGSAALRTSGRRGAGGRPSAASVQQGLGHRENKARVRQNRQAIHAGQDGRQSMRSTRGKSSNRSHGRLGRSRSAERSIGHSLRDGGSRRSGAKSQRAGSGRQGAKSQRGGNARHGHGGSEDKR